MATQYFTEEMNIESEPEKTKLDETENLVVQTETQTGNAVEIMETKVSETSEVFQPTQKLVDHLPKNSHDIKVHLKSAQVYNEKLKEVSLNGQTDKGRSFSGPTEMNTREIL